MTMAVQRNAGGWRIGESHHRAKHSDDTVLRILELHEDIGMSCRRISDLLDISWHTVREICSYRTRTQAVALRRARQARDSYGEGW